MHRAAELFVNQHATAVPVTVVEVGSRNINGTVRDLFPEASWWGIDTEDGVDVDEVADGATWQPPELVDVVVCCEVLEHAADWRAIVANMAGMVKPGGKVIVTAAGPDRMPHSAVDGGPLRDGEHYGNIDPDDLAAELAAAGLTVSVGCDGQDVQAVGVLDAKPKKARK